MKLAAFLIAFVTIVGIAQAQQATYRWTNGAFTNQWGDAGNWKDDTLQRSRTNPLPSDIMHLWTSGATCTLAANTDPSVATVYKVDIQGMTLTLEGNLFTPSTGGDGVFLTSNSTVGNSTLTIGRQLILPGGEIRLNSDSADGVSTLNITNSTAMIARDADQPQYYPGVPISVLSNNASEVPLSTVNQTAGRVFADLLTLKNSKYNLSGDNTYLSTYELFFANNTDKQSEFHQEGGVHDVLLMNAFWNSSYLLSGGMLNVIRAYDPWTHEIIEVPNGSIVSGDLNANLTQEGGILNVEGTMNAWSGSVVITGGDTYVGSITGSVQVGDESHAINPQIIHITNALCERWVGSEPITYWFALDIGDGYNVLDGSWCNFILSKDGDNRETLLVEGSGSHGLGKTTIAFDPGFTNPVLRTYALDDGPNNVFYIDANNPGDEKGHYVIGELDVGAVGSSTQMMLELAHYPDPDSYYDGRALYVRTLKFINHGTFSNVHAVYNNNVLEMAGPPIYIAGWGGAGHRLIGGDSAGGGDGIPDGKVSFADYLIFEANFGKSGMGWGDGDWNGDGKVTFADYLILEANFGKSGDSMTGGGNEPSLMSLPGEPAFLPELTDLNGDGKIDDADMLILIDMIRQEQDGEE